MLVPESLLQLLEVPGPSYSSYPTSDRFVEAFGPQAFRLALRQRAQGARVGGVMPHALVVHTPSCELPHGYGACDRVYLRALQAEIDLHVAELGREGKVLQLHLGGGTLTFLAEEELQALMSMLIGAFRLEAGAEISIEAEPHTVSTKRLTSLAAMGFRHLSLGVQDCDPDVQREARRAQPFDAVRSLIDAARDSCFESIKLDLACGLPSQTVASFELTLAQVAQLRPDRIALHTCTRLPQRFKPQRQIDGAALPAPRDLIRMRADALTILEDQGYIPIGMDHFVLPGDALAVAKRQGRLHRNVQGYTTQPDADLIGLGVSAIGRIGATYSQNAKTLPEYCDALSRGIFPIACGLVLTRDDLVRRTVIMALMCQGRVEFESIELAHLIRMREYFSQELASLQALVQQGLIEVAADALQLTATGVLFAETVAMVFDRHRQVDAPRGSRII